MPKAIKINGLKPAYSIAVNEEDNSAEINMYGEVVATRPIDWWTGEPIPGNFIAQDEFLRDLDGLSGKSSITVHINSVGGDMYAGLAIYNRLKGLAGKVVTINDGLAASAGSLIFQAGDVRKMNAGSNLMIHGAACLLYGYYQVQDLKAAIKQLDAHNRAGINVYVERTGRAADEIKPLVDRETWMTGQDAVDQGFADELVSNENGGVLTMKLTPDKGTMMVNGYPVVARCIGKLPENIPVMTDEEWAEMSTPESGEEPHPICVQPVLPDHNNTHQNGGNHMEQFKTIDELREAYPDMVSQVETAAQARGGEAERERIRSIEAIEAVVGDVELVNAAKYGDKPMTAEQLAFAAMQKQAVIGANMLAGIERDAKNSGAGNVTSGSVPSVEPKMSDDEQAEALLISAIKNKKEG